MTADSRWLLSDSVVGSGVALVVAASVGFSVGFVPSEILAAVSTVEVGDAVVLSDIKESPSVVVVSAVDDAICWVVDWCIDFLSIVA